MGIATGTVVAGKVVVEDLELPERSTVTVLTHESDEEIRLSPEEEAELSRRSPRQTVAKPPPPRNCLHASTASPSCALRLRIMVRAAGEIERVDAWWREKRPAVPSPERDKPSAPLHLWRIRYFLCYRLGAKRWLFSPCGTPAARRRASELASTQTDPTAPVWRAE